ncbi:TonB-dependent receptor plug domain-containing protein [Sphingobium sp. CR2-8]|uniref:TonB-dependent receptor n=1 Tax=Sphingobium sp. CR2-8 TaxID=1306534 RepID=UPI002DBE3A39|nr:TonB-dependent receptor plug domain-containing protein [Sphingobium sp. CR2-8]MEC3911895.1 TonB-dependent receptor plug domain-containing protein [Sphingobium sp. CR2-8]
MKALLATGASIMSLGMSAAYAQTDAVPVATAGSSPQPTAEVSSTEDIVVTARARGETLVRVPVAVSSLSPAALERGVATDLTKVAELTPSVIISSTRQTGGGTIGIRGISSPANVAGFEQAVSVALDGVQTSNGRIAGIGFFDIGQVDVLRGPQALFFGKNSPAGVISLTSNGPTKDFEVSLGTGYEFVGNEVYLDGTVSGPISDTLGFRVAVRYRDLDGWMHNDAQPIANPFYNPATGAPVGAASLPGARHDRYGNNELLGRVTLEYKPTDTLTATLKVFHSRYRDQGPGTASQNIGPCVGDKPRMYGVVDPYGECKADNHTSNGDVSPTVGAGVPLTDGTGRSFGKLDFTSVSGRIVADLDKVTITSQTGYNYAKVASQYGLDHTVYSQLYSGETDSIKEFSQEIRFTTDLDGALNLAGGVYYQKTDRDYHADVKLNDANYNPIAKRFDSADILTQQEGRTLSGFGQVLWEVMPEVEFAAGVRYTNERKLDTTTSLYGFGAFNVANIIFPGKRCPAACLAGSPRITGRPKQR